MNRVILALGILAALVAAGAGVAEYSLAANPQSVLNAPVDTPSVTSVTTSTLTPTPLGTPVLCPPEFQDVPSTHPDYAYIHCVACQGSMDNFPCGQPGEPCVPPNNYPYFRPGNTYVGTRAEVCKLIVVAARWPIDTTGGPHFVDVPVCHPYYNYIETAYNHNIIATYACGGRGEPCPGVYFRPGNNATRAQFAKLIVLAEGWPILCPSIPTFRDVPPEDPFYCTIETAYHQGVIDGYSCGPNCLEFRPGNNIRSMTRAEIARTIARAFTTCSPAPTPTGTPPTQVPTCLPTTATPVATPTSTPTLCPPGAWTDAAPLPVAKARALGVNLDNYLYLFGGRPDDSTYTNEIYRYSFAANNWTVLTQTLPDLMTSNMGGGVLDFPEGRRIFIVGGSGAGSTVISRTLAFDPAGGTFTPKAPWPASPERIPGGWAVANNMLYVFGGLGLRPTTAVYGDIWVYDPMADAWSHLPASLSIARAYIATELMPDGLIYLAGGSQYIAGFLTDQTIFEKFSPVTQSISTGPPLPFARSNNQGYVLNGKFVVPMGGILTLTTDVQVYDPATNSWSLGPPGLHAVLNYSKGYGPGGSILVAGGRDTNGHLSWGQKLATVGGPCATPTVTTTPCPMTFSDVPPTEYFYEDVRCVYCRGAISGYGDGTFRPYNNTTRGQMTKVVVLAFNISGPYTPPTQTFNDVPMTHPFYQYVETAYAHNIVSGYNCGGPGEPCPGRYFRPGNLVTRAQLSKIIVLAAGWWTLPVPIPHFNDVPPGNPFFDFIEIAYCHQVFTGYNCGGPGEPCPGMYFRPGNNTTRAQITRMICRAIGNSSCRP